MVSAVINTILTDDDLRKLVWQSTNNPGCIVCIRTVSLSNSTQQLKCHQKLVTVLLALVSPTLPVAAQRTLFLSFCCWNEQWHHHLSGTRAEIVGSPAQALALALAALVACDKGRIFTMVCLIPRASRAARKNRYKEVKWCRRKFRLISYKTFILRSYVYWFSWQEKRRSYNTEHLHTKITLEQRLDQTQPMDFVFVSKTLWNRVIPICTL